LLEKLEKLEKLWSLHISSFSHPLFLMDIHRGNAFSDSNSKRQIDPKIQIWNE
jgi:hypothetical protein